MGARDPKSPRETGADERRDAAFLVALGHRVRDCRVRRNLSRKGLAADSGVSERYLAELESGRGNISILLLRQVSVALGIPLADLLNETDQQPVELALIQEFLQRLPRARLARVRAHLLREFGGAPQGRSGRIALLGLRGAGKSTLGAALAAELEIPFIELDREIEREAGTSLSEIFLMYGQAGYRRHEYRCLEKTLENHGRCVIATGGSIVSEPATGFIFATLVPQGNPSDLRYGLPLLDKVQGAIDRVQTGPKRQIHSVASDLGLNDPCLRQALHARGILTVGIPKTIEPVAPNPSAQDVRTILTEAG